MRCFSSPGSPPHPMHSDADDPKGPGCPIRRSPDQSLLPTPRGLSQGATSFIAFTRQGIHQMPFSRLRDARAQRQAQHTEHTPAFATEASVFDNFRPLRPMTCPCGASHAKAVTLTRRAGFRSHRRFASSRQPNGPSESQKPSPHCQRAEARNQKPEEKRATRVSGFWLLVSGFRLLPPRRLVEPDGIEAFFMPVRFTRPGVSHAAGRPWANPGGWWSRPGSNR